ncbi:MAG: ABC transporter permease, partial [Vulcanimicrobiaceae bacterium]
MSNLVHDRVRLIVTLIGVVFAVVLITIQIGLFLGFASTTSNLIDHAGADLWIMAPGTRDVDQVAAISESRLYDALTVPGVQEASRFDVSFADFKKPNGGTQSVLVVGFDPDVGLGAPWHVVAGNVKALRFPNTIMVDELYRQKLGITHIGQTVEIDGRRAEVVGFTRGIRSFTQSPYVFASTRTAVRYSRMRADQTKYVLVKVAPRADAATVQADLARRLPDVEVLTTDEFRHSTQFYWMFTTGAGLALLVAAVVGLAVGIVVVSQTLYAATVDHLAEYGTLRAMGAGNRYIQGVIIQQAVISGIVGYGLALLFTRDLLQMIGDWGPAILLPWLMLAG